MTRPNKQEGLSLETLSSQTLEFMARPEPTQLEDLSDASSLSKILVLQANVRLDWKVIARYKHSSLIFRSVSDEQKSFIRSTPGLSPLRLGTTGTVRKWVKRGRKWPPTRWTMPTGWPSQPWSSGWLFSRSFLKLCHSKLYFLSHLRSTQQISLKKKKKSLDEIGLYHPLAGITNLKYKLLCFLTPDKKISKRKALAFNQDRCCHLALCLQLILFH